MKIHLPSSSPRSISNPSTIYGLPGDPSPGHPCRIAVSKKLASPIITMGASRVKGSGGGGGGGVSDS
jgi:hypothetical protein